MVTGLDGRTKIIRRSHKTSKRRFSGSLPRKFIDIPEAKGHRPASGSKDLKKMAIFRFDLSLADRHGSLL
jgi:hypothetical protein